MIRSIWECIFPIVNKEKHLLFLLRSTTKTKNEKKKFKHVRILTATNSFQVKWSNWAPTGKLLISLLNEQNPHCYIHSTQYFPFFLFHYVTNSTVLCCKSVTLNNNKKKWRWGWIVIYNPTKNPIKLEENRCSPNACTFYKNNLK